MSETAASPRSANGLGKLGGKLLGGITRRWGSFGAALLASILAAGYWLVWASDRYVSEAHVVIQRTDLMHGQATDFAGLLTGASPSRGDQMLLRDHLLSVDMLKKLDAGLSLRAHYSQRERDWFSRLWTQDAPMERFHRHFLARASVDFDDYAGVLVIKAQAYEPKIAHAITSMMVQEGERFMNRIARDVAEEQVNFLEQQVAQMSDRVAQARQAVLRYQNKVGLVSPQATTENISGIIAKLEAQRVALQMQRDADRAYLVPDHPQVVRSNQQIAALDKQIAAEHAKLTSPRGDTLNRTVEEYQRLEMEAALAQDVYKTGLVALENGRIEATRKLKKVSVLVAPTMPEYPLQPRRWYNTVVFILVALLLAGVAYLLTAIVRDHKD